MLGTARADIGEHPLPGDLPTIRCHETAFEERALLCQGQLILGRKILCRVLGMGNDDVPYTLCPSSCHDRENLIAIQVARGQHHLVFRDQAEDTAYFGQCRTLFINDADWLAPHSLLSHLLLEARPLWWFGARREGRMAGHFIHPI